jgi:branched-subunit amino acid aminotransferase/4-amino-4-deoxychorismate lyase
MAVLDGQLMPVAEATIPVTDEGFVRGDGVFEALRVYGGRPYGLVHHLHRLDRSASGMRLRIDTGAIGHGVGQLVEAMGPVDYAIRIICTRGGRTIIKSEALHEFPESISLRAVQYRTTIVLDGLKTLSYGGNVLANRVAEEHGADEALLITPEGAVLEGPTASLFWSPDGEKLVTPPLSEGILASITREVILEAFEVEVRSTTIEELLAAKEAFLCSSIREIQAINRIDDHQLDAPGPHTIAAKQAYASEVEARLAPPGANNP